MDRKPMYYNVNHTKICREHYKGNSVKKLFQNIWTVLMVGSSPITHTTHKRKIH